MITSVACARAPPWRPPPDCALNRLNHPERYASAEISERHAECRRATGSDSSETYEEEDASNPEKPRYEARPRVPYIPPKYIAPWKARSPMTPRYGAPWRTKNIPASFPQDELPASPKHDIKLYNRPKKGTAYELGYDQTATQPPISTAQKQYPSGTYDQDRLPPGTYDQSDRISLGRYDQDPRIPPGFEKSGTRLSASDTGIYGESDRISTGHEQYIKGRPPKPWSARDQIPENLRRVRSYDRRNEGAHDHDSSRIIHLVRQLNPPEHVSSRTFTRVDGFLESETDVEPSTSPRFPWEMDRQREEMSENRERPRFPWEMEQPPKIPLIEDQVPEPRVLPPSLADLVIPDAELRRLRSQMVGLKERVKLRKREISYAVIQGLHERWKHSELIKIRFEGPPATMMKAMHEELEKRTGGFVIWRGGGALVIYRGPDYTGPPVRIRPTPRPTEAEVKKIEENEDNKLKEFVEHVPVLEENQYEREMDLLLAGLGPRYTRWKGSKPVPVDGDKLPEIDHTYRAPYRLLPFGVEPKLTDMEMTNLRRIAKAMPPHFVVSRNNGLQGLAHSIVRLWEKSEIAKIAVKEEKHGTNSERIARELKLNTGGILIFRSVDSMIFYRGKDFLPAEVAAAYEKRDALAAANEEDEDNARIMPTSHVSESVVRPPKSAPKEPVDSQLGTWMNNEAEEKRRAQVVKSVRATRARRIELQLRYAIAKKNKAETMIQKLDTLIERQEPKFDRETITPEERYTLQKLGLKMSAFLLIGKRGVFSGIVENMHLHWKYRDLVKVIYKGTDRPDIFETAKMLENESGGILVGIIPTSKGAAMVFYRGKNYQRPEVLRPKTLLTKRKALQKFTETQRRESLARHILGLEHDIQQYGYMLKKAQTVEDEGNDKAIKAYVENLIREEEAKEYIPLKKRPRDNKGLGPILRADPLTNRERLVLRKKALMDRKPCHFHIGKCNVLRGLIVSIRKFLKNHALVKIGTKGRAIGTSVQEIAKLIEDGTGAAFVCQEKHKLIFYRGWPDGTDHPLHMEEDITPELMSAVQEEDNMDSSLGRRFQEDHEEDSKSIEVAAQGENSNEEDAQENSDEEFEDEDGDDDGENEPNDEEDGDSDGDFYGTEDEEFDDEFGGEDSDYHLDRENGVHNN